MIWSLGAMRGAVAAAGAAGAPLADPSTAASADAPPTARLDEAGFAALYHRLARPLRAYLKRLSGDAEAADDLLQETYYRLLRAKVAHEDEAHRRHYLFRIATNLARDGYRRRTTSPDVIQGDVEASAGGTANHEVRMDLNRALTRLKRRERELLWLAYAQGSSHEEIGQTLGLKTGSIKPLLFRARRRLADLLRGGRRSGGTDA